MKKFLLVLIFIHIALLISCSTQQKSGGEYTNIILLIPDALRAKQLPCYGYSKIRTPTIDTLARDGVLFRNCFVKQPGTPISFSNLFSGSWAASTGLKKNEKTLAQYLKEYGFYTVGFVSSRILWSPEYHEKSFSKNEFNRGFDEYIQDVSLENYPYHRRSKDTTKDILKWLKENQKYPFFLFAHYMDPHSPHHPSYDAQIKLIDREIGKVIQTLKDLSLYENSLIILTSDHGESIGDPVADHASPAGHGWFLYLEQIQVPLIIKFPKNKHIKSVAQIVRNVDIMPTILDYVGAKYDEDKMDGVSLLPTINGNKKLGLISFHRTGSSRVCPEGSESVIFSDKDTLFQYIQGTYAERIREFYDITSDPDEQNNLYHDTRYKNLVIKATQLLREFNKRQRSFRKKESSRTSRTLGKKELRILRSLGYIEGGAPAPDIRRGRFMMSKDLSGYKLLKYHDLIRQNRWGVDVEDGDYALKIITLDNKKYFIIANKNRELFRYSKKDGFLPLKLKDVQDITLDSQDASLYILQNKRLKRMELGGKVEDLRLPGIKSFSSCQGIYVDNQNNLYIFEKEKIMRFNKKTVRSFNISDCHSNKFAVDEEGNMFIAEENEIIKYDKNGTFISSFGDKDIVNGISSVCVDEENMILVLEEESPSVIIFDGEGNKIASFQYNTYEFQERKLHMGQPVPTKQLFVCGDKIYIVDNWESILVYSLM